ncbi:XdhC family protein [Lentibacillus sp. N15]|uniref:XdhC family protein n=1 Tax=Lentibacillus songyuanensis TaxID=3136161 RepID=UPI0031BAB127
MANIWEIIDEIAHSREQSVLATIIQVEGSAYQKEGTSMLFLANGQQIGIISAGCLEADLAIRAMKLLIEPSVQYQTFVYDTSAEDDLSWGRGPGCNGKIHILLERVDAAQRHNLFTLQAYLHRGIPVVMMKIFGKIPSTICTFYMTQDQQIFGCRDVLSHPLRKIAQRENKSRLQYVESLDRSVYIHHFEPQPRLFIFGAGPDITPLVAFALQTDFAVTIWDWRSTRLDNKVFSHADLMTNPSIPETMHALDFRPSDSVMIMTHDFQKDKELLTYLLPKSQQINYFGILGPRKRTTKLLQGRSIPDHLHSPAGLTIGAKGPEEIAISIIADIIRNRKEKSYGKKHIINGEQNSSDLFSGRQK